MSVNESQKRDPRMWEMWRKAGAIGTHADSPIRSDRLAENSLGQYEKRFRQLEAEIKTSLKPNQPLTICYSNTQDQEDGTFLTINSSGRWVLRSETDTPQFTNKSKEFIGVLKKYAFVLNYNRLINPLHEDLSAGKLEAEDFSRKYLMAKESLDRSVEENPVPFAELLLTHMNEALQRRKGINIEDSPRRN